ncbi:MAG: LysR family transcriptional regulator [Paraglaciecola sp.]|uniref:LysR family transcriptional regulator n=1 Tax=Paraglaciecola sp. TaxID=1920173 RepID=UPI003297767C
MARFSLRQLEALVAVADTKNFNRAADYMYLSSSTISNLIAELEDRLGFPVFDRTTRKVSLTVAGREFLAYAVSVLQQMKVAEAAAIVLKEDNVRIVRVAAPQVVAATLLPEIIAAYRVTHPDVRVHIVDSSVISLSDQIVNGTADIAIGPEQQVNQGISVRPLFESRWILWCHPEHPMSTQSEVSWSELRPHDICAPGSDHEQSFANILNTLEPSARFQVSEIVDSVTTALGLVSQNIALAITPEFVNQLGLHKHLLQLPLVQPTQSRRYVLYSQSDLWVSDPVQGFADFIEQFVAAKKLS